MVRPHIISNRLLERSFNCYNLNEAQRTAKNSALVKIVAIEGSLEESVTNDMRSTLYCSNETFTQQEVTYEVHFSKPCYIYQWVYEVEQPGCVPYEVFAGSLIQSSTPLYLKT